VPDTASDYVAITRLQAAYADVVTRRAWPELEPLFVPDAPIHLDTVTRPVIELTGAGRLAAFLVSALERFTFFQFVILNAVIDIDGDMAHGRMNIAELRQDHGGEWSTAFGRYDDSYRRLDGGWRFATRHYRSIARRVGAGPADVFPG